MQRKAVLHVRSRAQILNFEHLRLVQFNSSYMYIDEM